MNIPTESRIFADRYFREARRIEALHASRLSAGATTWRAALDAIFDSMEDVSPIKRAAILARATAALRGIPNEDAMHVLFGMYGRKRSASLVLATFSAGTHPLGLDEDGLLVLKHAVICRRNSAELFNSVLTYISRHAVARLHERDHVLAAGSAFDIFGFLGILGLMTRTSAKHERSGLALRFGDVLAVGSIKRAPGKAFLDIRTVLPADEVRNYALLEQGALAHDAVREWLDERDPGRIRELAERIPFMARREDDYTLRMAACA